MAHSLARFLLSPKCPRVAPSACRISQASFSTSSALQARKRVRNKAPRRTNSVLEDDLEEIWEHFEDSADTYDSPTAGHIILQNERQMLHYMRLIEHEMPKLVAYRKPFVPPSADKPLIVRSVHYQGEQHPVSLKRVIVAPVDALPLKDDSAVHKAILLAGPRWSPVPHADSGVSGNELWGNGYIKIACEDFPKASQNLKWASDTLDKLVAEANNSADTFSDVPIDARHLVSKIRKAKGGDHRGNRPFNRTTIHDFPEEWLPKPVSLQ
ncbi:37S ribosomal protein S24, mitochondrial [Psilocybe cubensis]|uniref:Small ribosomal subunit protein mS35 mitochondrial conserved domain-containing protein n=2 Tax=Psilocybe cubensis TaxID=181762 RepID=A0A8H7Y8N4_PSICU|nr:37S ribosomal protein S24, mitochondrial [Psilocybe cubensis]KAH9487028.1 37S ribosomal protein S24, mitochondrial [Psilocybe cubensis]